MQVRGTFNDYFLAAKKKPQLSYGGRISFVYMFKSMDARSSPILLYYMLVKVI